MKCARKIRREGNEEKSRTRESGKRDEETRDERNEGMRGNLNKEDKE